MSSQFHEISEAYLKTADLKRRKSLGQYFTPRVVRERLLSRLPRIDNPKILDPANGTGEFLLSAKEYFGDCELHGWEIDKELVELSRRILPTARITCTDSLKQRYTEQFDYVIGNPPYFEFTPDREQRERFQNVINGRANIFSMFIKIGLEMLKPRGYLAYVIPPSMNNGAYFAGLRQYIIKHANVEYIAILDSSSMFHDALQTVMIMVLKKGRNKGDYIFTKNSIDIFTIEPGQLQMAFEGMTTLKELGFMVRTGKVVWNQHKERLTDNPEGAIPLLWAHNITDNGLVLGNSSRKPQYIKLGKYDIGPAIIVNRITGAATKVSLKAAVIEPGMRFLGENHVNVVYPPERSQQLRLGLSEPTQFSIGFLQRLCEAITSRKTIQTMQLVTGNTQISRTELECLLPLDLGKQPV